MGSFDESKHPRETTGEFTNKAFSESTTDLISDVGNPELVDLSDRLEVALSAGVVEIIDRDEGLPSFNDRAEELRVQVEQVADIIEKHQDHHIIDLRHP